MKKAFAGTTSKKIMSEEDFGRELITYIPQLTGYACKLQQSGKGNDFDVEDIVQETLGRALKKRSTYDPDQKMIAWVCTIMHNMLIDEARKKRGTYLHRDYAAVRQVEVDFHQASSATRAVNGDDTQHIYQIAWDQVMESMPEGREKMILTMRLEEQSVQEMAEKTGLKKSTVQIYLGRMYDYVRAFVSETSVDAKTLDPLPVKLCQQMVENTRRCAPAP